MTSTISTIVGLALSIGGGYAAFDTVAEHRATAVVKTLGQDAGTAANAIVEESLLSESPVTGCTTQPGGTVAELPSLRLRGASKVISHCSYDEATNRVVVWSSDRVEAPGWVAVFDSAAAEQVTYYFNGTVIPDDQIKATLDTEAETTEAVR